ncbi:hypothetical protein J0H58_18355 [bacterium]|nr:hypothetical protein [bacterium]
MVVTRWVWRNPAWVRRELPSDGPATGGGWVFAARLAGGLLAFGLLAALARGASNRSNPLL